MYDFTFIQMEHYRKYEAVRAEGNFNMWSPQAQMATGLNDDQYLFTLKNYVLLREQAEEEIRETTMTSNLANQFDVHF
jgi:hypothetical protein